MVGLAGDSSRGKADNSETANASNEADKKPAGGSSTRVDLDLTTVDERSTSQKESKAPSSDIGVGEMTRVGVI